MRLYCFLLVVVVAATSVFATGDAAAAPVKTTMSLSRIQGVSGGNKRFLRTSVSDDADDTKEEERFSLAVLLGAKDIAKHAGRSTKLDEQLRLMQTDKEFRMKVFTNWYKVKKYKASTVDSRLKVKKDDTFADIAKMYKEYIANRRGAAKYNIP